MTTSLNYSDSPAPTGDQQEHTTTTPFATIDDRDVTSLGSAPHIMDLCHSQILRTDRSQDVLRTISLSSSGETFVKVAHQRCNTIDG